MYAIVDVAGQQFKVEKDQKIYVHRLKGNEGDVVEFDHVLLIEDGDNILIGDPIVKGALVSGKILSHLKGDKVKVFKKKRRKGYQVLTGHRQYMSQILIEEILEKGGTKKEATRKVAEKPETKAKAKTPAKSKTSQAKKAPEKVKAKKAKAEPKGAAKKQPAPAKKSPAKTSPKAQVKAKTEKKKPAAKGGGASKKTTTKKAAPKKGDDAKKKTE